MEPASKRASTIRTMIPVFFDIHLSFFCEQNYGFDHYNIKTGQSDLHFVPIVILLMPTDQTSYHGRFRSLEAPAKVIP